MLTGLSGQYYTPPLQVRVDIPASGSFPGGNLPMAESAMQSLVDSQVGHPEGFLFGAAGQGNYTPSQFVQSVIAYAQSLCQGYDAPWTCQGFDPVARGTYYANLIISILKTIPAPSFGVNFSGSVYDVWAQGGSQNVLDHVAPQPVVIQQQPVYSNLNPPQYQPPQQTPQTTGSTQTLASLLPAGTSAWLSANWMLVAGGLAALLILPGLMGGRR